MYEEGKITKISGPLVVAEGLERSKMYDLVYVGELELLGEIIRIEGKKAFIQVYEETEGLKIGEPVKSTLKPLTAMLGPGLIGSIYDGVQRPLKFMAKKGAFIRRGDKLPAIDLKKKWEFIPTVKRGDTVKESDILGYVEEGSIKHLIMVPHGVNGKVEEIEEGKLRVEDVIAYISGKDVKMFQEWPVRKPRPFKERLYPEIPMITGMRVIDVLFPIAKGGTAAIPGGFGTGKTVTQQTIAKHSDVDIVIYVGCGERGNEMADVLEEFSKLEDPKTGKLLIDRTVLIANTSNMPVAARESSIYLGATIGEYFREMGYNVALMADSTSRWAEALREISSRLGEMPGEEGYPAYLATRIAEFYERAGRVLSFNGKEGSLTIIGAVSPPGGDFSEPVTQATLAITKVFWMLDKELAKKRHYPAINWTGSYSLYADSVASYWVSKIDKEYSEIRKWLLEMLSLETQLREIVQLVGYEGLRDREKLLLLIGKMIREDFLQQNAFSEDAYNEPKKQIAIAKVIRKFYEFALRKIKEDVTVEEISKMDVVHRIARLKEKSGDEFYKEVEEIEKILRGD